jgi:predicted ATP-binding protein involved in virulence
MKIKNITINNFRGAKDISIDFVDNINVFAGINGSGKTTILESLSLSLSWLLARIQRQNSSGNSIAESDIRYDSQFSSIKINCEENKKQYSWKLVKAAKGKNTVEKTELGELSELAYYFQNVLEDQEKLPVIAYYPVTRVVNKVSPELRIKDDFVILDVYDNALGIQQNYKSFFEWFRLQDDILNEKAVSRSKWIQQNKNYIKKQVGVIVELIKKTLLDSDIKNDEFHFFTKRITQDEFIFEEPRFFFHEISRLIHFSNSRSKRMNEMMLFDDLEYMFHKMDSLSRDYKDNLIRFDTNYQDIVYNMVKRFNTFLQQDELEHNFVKIFWEFFIFANTLSFWWLSDKGRREMEKVFRDSLNNLIEKKEKRQIVSEQIITSINLIFKKEIKQRESSLKSDGNELKIVAKAIEQFIPNYSSLRVKRMPRPHMLINKGDEEFNLNQLSDGEKNLITLVGDIARRLAIANPNSKEPLKGNGIILIDEIDLHLHPSWQRLMIPRLSKVFPNCQFIVSTHSPQVLNHTKPESIILLNNKKGELKYSKTNESYGKNSDRILEDLLDVDARPTEIKNRIKELYKLIDLNEIENAKLEIDLLSKILVGGDPELVKANVLIKRKEIIGK